jgi:hypothetical protein
VRGRGRKRHTLLTSTQLLNPLLLIKLLGVERNTNPHPRVVLHGSMLVSVRLFRFLPSVRPALNHQTSMAGGHELLENGGKLLGHLLEGALDGLVLALIEVGDKLLDGGLRLVELLAALHKLVLLGREGVVLLNGLLVDVLELFEGFVDALEL